MTWILAQVDQPLIRWSWITDHVDDIVSRGSQHLWLTVVSVAIGFVIAFPLAIVASRRPWITGPSTAVASILYTIPALALIALLIPFTGLSLTTATVPLVMYNLLIVFRNSIAGLRGVEADVKEAAVGMGYTRRQLLWRVEVPLAIPVIIAGLRIATVSTIGLVTIAALIGRGGFGQFILLGLDTFFWTALLVGAVLSVGLAVVADVLLILTQRLVTPWAKSDVLRGVAT